jgi:hypothetical protein
VVQGPDRGFEQVKRRLANGLQLDDRFEHLRSPNFAIMGNLPVDKLETIIKQGFTLLSGPLRGSQQDCKSKATQA